MITKREKNFEKLSSIGANTGELQSLEENVESTS